VNGQMKNKTLCECGCGEYAKLGNRFLKGHSSRMKWVREKISKSHSGKSLSKEHKMKLSESHKGEKNHFYGKAHSKESIEKISNAHKGKKLSKLHIENLKKSALRGDDNPAKRSEVREKISEKMKGRVITKEWREKISNAHKGMKHSEETKAKIKTTRLYGDDNPAKRSEVREKISLANKGRKFSEKTRLKMSLASFERFSAPCNHPRWKGGSSKEEYCHVWGDKEFKEDIKERDNYKCQNPDCWDKNCDLVIHHIDYDKKNCHPDNLITLCRSCNARANADKKFWTKLYREAVPTLF